MSNEYTVQEPTTVTFTDREGAAVELIFQPGDVVDRDVVEMHVPEDDPVIVPTEPSTDVPVEPEAPAESGSDSRPVGPAEPPAETVEQAVSAAPADAVVDPMPPVFPSEPPADETPADQPQEPVQ